MLILNISLLEALLVYKQMDILFLAMKKFTINYSKTELTPPTYRHLNVVPRQDISHIVPANLHYPFRKYFLTNYRVSLHHTNV